MVVSCHAFLAKGVPHSSWNICVMDEYCGMAKPLFLMVLQIAMLVFTTSATCKRAYIQNVVVLTCIFLSHQCSFLYSFE